jgi:hypothetical protein
MSISLELDPQKTHRLWILRRVAGLPSEEAFMTA